MVRFRKKLRSMEAKYQISSFYDKLYFLTSGQLYGDYILEHYTKEEIETCEGFFWTAHGISCLRIPVWSCCSPRYVIRSPGERPVRIPPGNVSGHRPASGHVGKDDRLELGETFLRYAEHA